MRYAFGWRIWHVSPAAAHTKDKRLHYCNPLIDWCARQESNPRDPLVRRSRSSKAIPCSPSGISVTWAERRSALLPKRKDVASQGVLLKDALAGQLTLGGSGSIGVRM